MRYLVHIIADKSISGIALITCLLNMRWDGLLPSNSELCTTKPGFSGLQGKLREMCVSDLGLQIFDEQNSI